LLSRNIELKIYATILLPLVLYGCERWSVLLRRIFGPKRKEKFYNEGCHDLHCSPNII